MGWGRWIYAYSSLSPGVKIDVDNALKKGWDVEKFGSKDCRMPPRVELDAAGYRVIKVRGWVKGLGRDVDTSMDHMSVPHEDRDDFLYYLTAIEAGIQEETEKRRPKSP